MQLAMLDDNGTLIPDQLWPLPQPFLDSLALLLADQLDADENQIYPSEFAAICADLGANFAARTLRNYPPADAVAAEQNRLTCMAAPPPALRKRLPPYAIKAA